jgi:hypothetical protein
MRVFDEKHDELKKFEFMMGAERGRLAVALDLLTDAMVLAGQHGVYCVAAGNPERMPTDLKLVVDGIEGAKQLIQSVMEELRVRQDSAPAQG